MGFNHLAVLELGRLPRTPQTLCQLNILEVQPACLTGVSRVLSYILKGFVSLLTKLEV